MTRNTESAERWKNMVYGYIRRMNKVSMKGQMQNASITLIEHSGPTSLRTQQLLTLMFKSQTYNLRNILKKKVAKLSYGKVQVKTLGLYTEVTHSIHHVRPFTRPTAQTAPFKQCICPRSRKCLLQPRLTRYPAKGR